MTRERSLGALGRRLFVAFLVVAMSSVLVLTGAALVGTARGLDTSAQQQRQAQAGQLANRVAQAYRTAGGWNGLDLTGVGQLADALGVRVRVQDARGTVVAAWDGGGAVMGMGMMDAAAGQGGRWATAAVQVGGVAVGSVAVRFPTPLTTTSQSIAWWWIILAALAALLVSFAVAWFVSRRISAPLLRISSAARRFAAGDRSARTDPRDAASGWELGELARAFDATADAVVASESARRRVSADVAHELRTPLAALQAGLEELKDGYVEAEPQRLAALHAQAVRLGRLVADLSALSAAESASLTIALAPVDLADLAQSAAEVAAPALEAAGITHAVHGASGIVVQGDADRLHQVLLNLLMNAARHCRRGDHVIVSVSADERHAHVRVADSGPGIPESQRSQVFERLWRGTDASDVEGSGIGLAVVRELVTAHHGRVWVEERDGGGSVFVVELPRR